MKDRKVWFASDHHFGHELMRKMRNFDTIQEHDQALIDAHNKVVGKDDDVYFLGDFVFKASKEWEYYSRQLNGNLHLVRGNHDKIELGENLKGFKWVKDYHEERFPNLASPNWRTEKHINFVLFHYPIYCWHWNNQGAIHPHGHTHLNVQETEVSRGKTLDVCVNPDRQWQPYELRDIILLMQKREKIAPDCQNY